MGSIIMSFRIDEDVKNQMTQICKELGMNTSTALNIFASEFVRTKGMPFSVGIKDGTSDAENVN